MWSGKKYDFDESILDWVKEFDVDKKIEIYEDDFVDKTLSTMGNDERERKMVWEKMADEEDSWHLQIDTDEYFVDFKSFVDYLHQLEQTHTGKMSVKCNWVTLFKETREGYLYIDNKKHYETVHIASTNGFRFHPTKGELMIQSPFKILHQSWARSEEEVYQKIKNWSHNSDFDTDKYYDFWKSINGEHYKSILNFHPLYGPFWEKLSYAEGSVENSLTQLSSVIISPNPKEDIKKAKKERFLNLFKGNIIWSIGNRVMNYVRKQR